MKKLVCTINVKDKPNLNQLLISVIKTKKRSQS